MIPDLAGHQFAPVTDLCATCQICLRRFSIVHFFDPNHFPKCLGPPQYKIRYMQGPTPRKNVLIDNLLGTCECGAHKTGIKPFHPGHSSWCPVFK